MIINKELFMSYINNINLIVSGWKKNYERHFPVKWWPLEVVFCDVIVPLS